MAQRKQIFDMTDTIPIWKTHGSMGKSILTAEDDDEILDNYPVSIISIAKRYKLKQLMVIDDSFVEFPKLLKNCNKYDIQLIFGLNFTLCNDANEKTEESRMNDHKVSVLMKNSAGYKDLILLNNAINANPDNFYYCNRGDYKILNKHMTDNLVLLIPPHDNFIHKNLLENGKIIPKFEGYKPIFTYCDIELPYTEVLNKSIHNYANNNKYDLKHVHPIVHFSKKDYKAYQNFRAIANRKTYNNPNIEFFCNDSFSWESYNKGL